MIVLTVFAATLAAPAGAAIYKWVDENGAVRFSDKRPAEQQAQVFVPQTSVGASFDKGSDAETSDSGDLQPAESDVAEVVTPPRIKETVRPKLTKKQQEELEKTRAENARRMIRSSPEYKKALRAQRRKNKFINQHPEYQQNVKPLTPDQQRILSLGREPL